MSHLTKNLLYIIGCFLFGISCTDIIPNPYISKSIPAIAHEQIILDSITNLIKQKDWYAAQMMLGNLKNAYPNSPNNNKITESILAVRKGLNKQIQEKNTGQNAERFEQLTQSLRRERDELKRRTFYHANTSTTYLNEEAVKVYLNIPFDTLQNAALHFTVQQVSTANYPLQYVQFVLDGKVYPYLPETIKRDGAQGVYWQWFDDVFDAENSLHLLKKIAASKSAEILFYFNQNYKSSRIIPAEEKKAMAEVLEVYDSILRAPS